MRQEGRGGIWAYLEGRLGTGHGGSGVGRDEKDLSRIHHARPLTTEPLPSSRPLPPRSLPPRPALLPRPPYCPQPPPHSLVSPSHALSRSPEPVSLYLPFQSCRIVADTGRAPSEAPTTTNVACSVHSSVSSYANRRGNTLPPHV